MTTQRPKPHQTGGRGQDIRLHLHTGAVVKVRNDIYSDRIRCDHPKEGEGLGPALLQAATRFRRSRVVVFAPPKVSRRLRLIGFKQEAVIPKYYRGDEDCSVLGYFLSPERRELANPKQVRFVEELLETKRGTRKEVGDITTHRAAPEDATEVAELVGQTFPEYPTPSAAPEYMKKYIAEGNPVRYVREDDKMVACASADLVTHAKTAELTDCSTRPEYRGRGFMQALLLDLMGDLANQGYPTAFTLARARIPGMNLAFQRLGFELHGTMTQSCRIGEGIEDINVWSRSLENLAQSEVDACAS